MSSRLFMRDVQTVLNDASCGSALNSSSAPCDESFVPCEDADVMWMIVVQVQLQAMLQMKQVEVFHEQVLHLQSRLIRADSVLLLWLRVQRTWAYLEGIFKGSEDISSQLPEDTQRFYSIDQDFKVH